MLGCATNQDSLQLATLRYLIRLDHKDSMLKQSVIVDK